MPISEKTVVSVVCDNASCPGNDLDSHDLTGWIVVNSEVYGEPSTQNVFCSSACVSEAAASAADDAPSLFGEGAP
jgi:hypothetical protein